MTGFIASYIVPFTFFVLTGVFLAQALGKKRLENYQHAILVALIFCLAVIPVWSVSGPVGDAAKKGQVRADDIRISLDALSVEANDIEQVRIGGDRETDWIYVKDVAANLLSFRRDSPATNADERNLENPEHAPIEMVVKLNKLGPGSLVTYERTGGMKKSRKIVGARKLSPGENICVNCTQKPNLTSAEQCNVTMPGKSKSLSMKMGGKGLTPIQLRRLKGPVPALVNYDASTRIYSLRNFGRPLDGKSASPNCQSFVDEENLAVLPTGFIYKEKSRNSPFYGALLPRGPDTATIPLKLEKGGAGLRIRLFRVRYAEPGENPESEDLIERLAERRSFIVSQSKDGALRIRFDTPEISQIKAKNIANAIAKKDGDDARLVLTFDSTDERSSDASYTDAIVGFRSLGRPAARTTVGQVELPLKDGNVVDLENEFYPPNQDIRSSKKFPHPWGKSFNLGRNVQATITLDRLDHFANLPVLLYTLLLASIFINFFALYKPIAQKKPVLWSLALVVQALICLRILIGISGGYVDPDASDSAGGAIMLLAITPIVLYLISGNFMGGWRTLISVSFLGFVFTTLKVAGKMDDVSKLLFGLTVVFLGISYFGTRFISMRIISVNLGWTNIVNFVDTLISKQVSWSKGGGATKQKLKNIATSRVAFMVGGLLVIRAGLALFGQKEAITFIGPRLSNSIWYIPGAILVLAILWSWYHRNIHLQKSLWFSIFVGLALGVLFFAPAVILNDVGIIIFCLGSLFCIMLDSMAGADRRILAAAAGYAVVSLLIFGMLVQQVVVGANLPKLAFVTLLTSIALCAFFIDVPRAKRPFVLLILIAVLIVIYWAFDYKTIDNGMIAILVAILAFIGILLMPDNPGSPWVEALVKVRPAVLFIGLMMLLVSFYLPAIGTTSQAQDEALSSEAEIERQLKGDQNKLRLLFILNPDASRDFGTVEAERLSAALAHFSDYTDCPEVGKLSCRLTGQGFLNVPKPTELYAVHMDDNVSAIYLTAQFGRASAAGLISMLLGFALFFSRATHPRPLNNETNLEANSYDVSSRPLVIYGRFLVWTVAFVALYMVLANYRIVPFTGQNIFFLAAKSGSDALFGLTVFGLIAVSLKRYANG